MKFALGMLFQEHKTQLFQMFWNTEIRYYRHENAHKKCTSYWDEFLSPPRPIMPSLCHPLPAGSVTSFMDGSKIALPLFNEVEYGRSQWKWINTWCFERKVVNVTVARCRSPLHKYTSFCKSSGQCKFADMFKYFCINCFIMCKKIIYVYDFDCPLMELTVLDIKKMIVRHTA